LVIGNSKLQFTVHYNTDYSSKSSLALHDSGSQWRTFPCFRAHVLAGWRPSILTANSRVRVTLRPTVSRSVSLGVPDINYCLTVTVLSILYNLGTDCIENTPSNSSSFAACSFCYRGNQLSRDVPVVAKQWMCLQSRSLTTAFSTGFTVLASSRHVTILWKTKHLMRACP
jgi:hypothetical protein